MHSDPVTTLVSSGPAAPGDLVELGRISGAYGIHGWVRVRTHSAQDSTLLHAQHWWLKPPVPASGAGGFALERQVQVAACRVHGDAIVARFTGMSDRTQAEGLKGWSVWVSRAGFAPLEPDEYYWIDLVGCRLYGDDHGQQVLIGQVSAVTDNGAHGVLHVACAAEKPDGQLEFMLDKKGRQRETLVPFVAAHVHTVDLKNKQLFSNWPADL